jgi:hypothetical protein
MSIDSTSDNALSDEQKKIIANLTAMALVSIRNNARDLLCKLKKDHDLEYRQLDEILRLSDGFHNIPNFLFSQKCSHDHLISDAGIAGKYYHEKISEALGIIS